jgi:hypothetical protein
LRATLAEAQETLFEVLQLHRIAAMNTDYRSRQILRKSRAVRRKLKDSIAVIRTERQTVLAAIRKIPKGGAREAAKRERTPCWFGEFDRFVLQEAIALCRVRLNSTGVPWHVDHCYPLQSATVSGLHVGLNLQVIPASVNISKRSRAVFTQPFEWMASCVNKISGGGSVH